jgi:hypothetical protein
MKIINRELAQAFMEQHDTEHNTPSARVYKRRMNKNT